MQDLFHQQYQLTWNLKITQLKREIIRTKPSFSEVFEQLLGGMVFKKKVR